MPPADKIFILSLADCVRIRTGNVAGRRSDRKLTPTMDWLTAFGLFAVTAMLVFYALESVAGGSFLLLRELAYWVRFMVSYKALGLSA
jgi:hypothetical protein